MANDEAKSRPWLYVLLTLIMSITMGQLGILWQMSERLSKLSDRVATIEGRLFSGRP